MIQRSARMEDLEQRFSQLEAKLKDSPEKELFSILHAMILESRRQIAQQPASNQNASTTGNVTGSNHAGDSYGRSLDEVANLYKTAPAMEGHAQNEGLPEGTLAPDFNLKDANGRDVSLQSCRGQNVLLVFYPLDWSPACSDQLSLYQSELGEFNKYHVKVLGISVDSLYSHGAWAAVRGLEIPLLADFNPKGEVARKYKIYRDSDGFSERALYLIDKEGVIRYRYISPELRKIPDIYELFDHLQKVGEIESGR